jgi:TonB family protein
MATWYRFGAAGPRLAMLSVGTYPPWEGVVSMRASWGNRFLAAAGVSVLATSVALGQQSSVEDSKRKIKFKVNPQYTDLARTMHISGKVKIELVIAPDGHVKTARAVGGHPVLVQSCLDAVRDWKFEAAPEETTQIIEFDFKASS